MKKLLFVSILTILLFNLIMFSLPVATFAQEAEATEVVETSDTEEIEETSDEEDSGGVNAGVWIAIGVALALSVGVAVRSGGEQKTEQQDE